MSSSCFIGFPDGAFFGAEPGVAAELSGEVGVVGFWVIFELNTKVVAVSSGMLFCVYAGAENIWDNLFFLCVGENNRPLN